MSMSKKELQTKIDSVLDSIREGVSVRESCARAGISLSCFLEKVDGERYARARDCQADAHFDEMADLERQCRDGVIDHQRFKALLESRKWRLARMRPKVYGDKALPAQTRETPPAPDPVQDLSRLSPDQLLELARNLFQNQAQPL